MLNAVSRSEQRDFWQALDQRIAKGEQRFLVVGGGGWISRALLDRLDRALGKAVASRVTVLGSSARTLTLASGATLQCQDLAVADPPSPGRWVVMHNAFLTRDKVAAMDGQAYLDQNRAVRGRVMALIEALQPEAVFLPSSGAAYAGEALDFEANPYGALKVEEEQALETLRTTLGFTLVLARIFALSGRFINKPELYAIADMIAQADRTGEVSVKARLPVYRSYLDVEDLIGLVLDRALLAGGGTERFDATGAEAVEMSALARRVLRLAGHPEGVVHRQLADADGEDRYLGDPSAIGSMFKAAGLPPLDLDAQIANTRDHLRSRPAVG